MTTVQSEIETLLRGAFTPSSLIVNNDSAKHRGHMGDDGTGESHFSVNKGFVIFGDNSKAVSLEQEL